jgi:hypothetical protein
MQVSPENFQTSLTCERVRIGNPRFEFSSKDENMAEDWALHKHPTLGLLIKESTDHHKPKI